MSGFSQGDIPVKTGYAAEHRGTSGINIPLHLRPLLVMIDGRRTVRDLLALGLRNVSVDSFDELYAFGVIEGGSESPSRFHESIPSAAMAAMAPKKGLSEARFLVIDTLLDISTQDFQVRPWVERMENARTLEILAHEVQAFIVSPLGAKKPALHAALRRALGGTG
jgi:hypothetical protein